MAHAARIAARQGDGPLVAVALALPADVIATHRVPGQYISITAGGEDGFFVLGSAVGAPRWELLVRASGTVSEALLSAPLGTTFPATAALGDGFPMAEARGRALVLLAAGTGIAAAAPILALRTAEGDAPRTQVFLGLRSAGDLPSRGPVDAWRHAGATVTVCVSREDPSGPGVARGYVQDVAAARLERGSGAIIFAVGPEPMIEGARALAKSLGMPETDFRTNY